MSKLTSFTSASDALIQPTGATNGQTLTWNATAGQFEPTNPPSGDTPELPLWQPGTAYDVGDTVLADTANNAILRRNVANTSASTLTVSGLTRWDYVGQRLITSFPVSSLVPLGFLISQQGVLYRALSNRITGATFDTTEQANWTALTSSPQTSASWASATVYRAGDLANFTFASVSTLLRRKTAGTSGNIIDAAELSNWEYVSQVSSPAFPATTLIPAGFKIAVTAGNLYESTGNNTTTATFNAAEQLNWRALSEPECRPWLPNLFYVGGDLVFQAIGGIATYLRRVSIGTSGAAFDLTELTTWNYVTQAGIPTVFPANTIVPSRFQISIGGVLYFSNTSRTTGATFDAAEQVEWTALTSAGGTTLPNLTANLGLRGDGTNVPVTDGRITFDIAAGAVDISATGSGNLTLGSGSTGAINIGNSTKTTNLNGLVKQPGKSVFKAQRATSIQAIAANTQTTVIFNASSLLGTSATPVTLDTTTGVMTFTRTGTYRISGCISVQSATANARVGLAFVAGTAVCTPTNIENNLLATANVPRACRFEYVFTCTTVGTFSIQIGSTAALTVGFNQGTIFAPTKTNCIIDEVA